MKKLMITIIAMLTVSIAMGQKAKELKIQMQQLAKIKLQSVMVKQKNKIDQEGLDKIGNYKNGTYSLYNDYFNSLRTVNSNVRNDDKAQNIRDMFLEIRRVFPITISRASSSGFYDQREVADFQRVYDKIFKDGIEIIRNLNAVTDNGQYEMTDDQRIKRIDHLHQQMQSAYVFYRKFCSDIDNVRRARERARQDARRMQQLYGQDSTH